MGAGGKGKDDTLWADVDSTDMQRYLVLPEPTVSAHKHVLSQHLAPQIDTLITKSESNIEAQRTKIKRLEERLSLLEQAKLPVLPDETASAEDSADAGDDSDAMEDKLQGVDLKEINPAQRRKIMLLKGKRARLEKERQQLRL